MVLSGKAPMQRQLGPAPVSGSQEEQYARPYSQTSPPKSCWAMTSQLYISAPQGDPCLSHPYPALMMALDTRQREASCLLWSTHGHPLPLGLRLGWGQGQGAGGKGQGWGLHSCPQLLNCAAGSTGLRNPGQCRAGQFYKQLQKNLSHTLEAHAAETLAVSV